MLHSTECKVERSSVWELCGDAVSRQPLSVQWQIHKLWIPPKDLLTFSLLFIPPPLFFFILIISLFQSSHGNKTITIVTIFVLRFSFCRAKQRFHKIQSIHSVILMNQHRFVIRTKTENEKSESHFRENFTHSTAIQFAFKKSDN